MLAGAFIYLEHFGMSHPLMTTVTTLLWLYLLLPSKPPIWFWSGFFIGIMWFWWVALSFVHYKLPWLMPIAIPLIGLVYGLLFFVGAKTSEWVTSKAKLDSRFALFGKALYLIALNYIHPFGFNWFKPHLGFTLSYFGVEWWHFGIVLFAIVLAHFFRQPLLLLLSLLAINPNDSIKFPPETPKMTLVTSHITVEQKWDPFLQEKHHAYYLEQIDNAIAANKKIVVLPESAFATFLNRDQTLFDALLQRAQKIIIVTGALFLDKDRIPRNSTFIFQKDKNVLVANKVILVPFGEANPLPEFFGKWINRIFYDGGVDYKAASTITDYRIDDKIYRNAICYEATTHMLYEGNPKRMIVLSNNGWFVPSIEPTLQRILLHYFNRIYGTTIYHAINGSPSYIIKRQTKSYEAP